MSAATQRVRSDGALGPSPRGTGLRCASGPLLVSRSPLCVGTGLPGALGRCIGTGLGPGSPVRWDGALGPGSP
eukprot:3613559-Heterocapsa_arctica.AAC.1